MNLQHVCVFIYISITLSVIIFVTYSSGVITFALPPHLR